MSKYVDDVEFATEQCCNCGMAFAVTADFQKRRRDDHKQFYCPAGHQQFYNGKTEAQKLREELERKGQMLDAANQRAARIERQRNDVAKAHMRMRDRIKNGVCPCCNRTFQNLLQHMRTEHNGQLPLRTLREAYGLTQAALADEIGVTAGQVSAAERGKPVGLYAQTTIDSWVERQAPAIKEQSK